MRIRLRGAAADLDFGLVDRHAGIVVSPVNDAERIDLGRPSIGVKGLCVRFVAVGEDFVDGDVLPRLRLLDELAIMVAPPGRDIAAERAPFVTGAAARPRRHVVDPDLDHVARLRVLDMDRAGADVHAEAFAGAAAEDGGVDRAGAAPVDGLSVFGPEKDLFRRRVAPDHQFGIVRGVLGQRFNLDAVAGTDLEDRPQRTAEIAPMHIRRTDREAMAGAFIPPVPRRRQAAGESRQSRCAA